MYSVRDVVEAFMRLVKSEVQQDAVLVPPDDAYEVQRLPSLLVQGPRLVEDKDRRTMAKQIVKDTDALTYEEREYPRFYHLDFDFVVTTAKEAELLDTVAGIVVFFAFHREIVVPPDGHRLNLTELVPIGGLNRVNLTNLRQSSGRYRIEDCLVYGNNVTSGKLVLDRKFDYADSSPIESRTHEPPQG